MFERGSLIEDLRYICYLCWLVSAMTSPSDKLGQLLSLFLKPFWRSRNAFRDKFRHKNYFTENFEAKWTKSFNIRAKIKINICQCVTLGRRVCFGSQDLMFVGGAF